MIQKSFTCYHTHFRSIRFLWFWFWCKKKKTYFHWAIKEPVSSPALFLTFANRRVRYLFPSAWNSDCFFIHANELSVAIAEHFQNISQFLNESIERHYRRPEISVPSHYLHCTFMLEECMINEKLRIHHYKTEKKTTHSYFSFSFFLVIMIRHFLLLSQIISNFNWRKLMFYRPGNQRKKEKLKVSLLDRYIEGTWEKAENKCFST